MSNSKLSDSQAVVTPVIWKRLHKALVKIGYPADKREYLVNGFRFGFRLGATGA